jgi:hypothetical protein
MEEVDQIELEEVEAKEGEDEEDEKMALVLVGGDYRENRLGLGLVPLLGTV